MTAVPRSQLSIPPRTETSARRESTESSSSEEIQIEKDQFNKEAGLQPAASPSLRHREETRNGLNDRDRDRKRGQLDDPEAELLLRLRERHGTSVNAEAILQCVLEDLGWNTRTLKTFLDFDEKQTTAPDKLKNPPGHYRRAVQKFHQASAKRREHELRQQQLALEAKLSEQAQAEKSVCSLSICSGNGERWNEQGVVSACECEQGKRLSAKVLEAFEQLNASRRSKLDAAVQENKSESAQFRNSESAKIPRVAAKRLSIDSSDGRGN
jgi:hypothetical protein